MDAWSVALWAIPRTQKLYVKVQESLPGSYIAGCLNDSRNEAVGIASPILISVFQTLTCDAAHHQFW